MTGLKKSNSKTKSNNVANDRWNDIVPVLELLHPTTNLSAVPMGEIMSKTLAKKAFRKSEANRRVTADVIEEEVEDGPEEVEEAAVAGDIITTRTAMILDDRWEL